MLAIKPFLAGVSKSYKLSLASSSKLHAAYASARAAKKTKSRSKSDTPPFDFDKKSVSAIRLVEEYRQNGHNFAKVNPLKSLDDTSGIPPLATELISGLKTTNVALKELGVTASDSVLSFSDLSDHLSEVYCGPLSAQFTYLPPAEADFIAKGMESLPEHLSKLTSEQKYGYMKLLHQSEIFDLYLTKKFRTVKRYGLEGNESLLVAMDEILQSASSDSKGNEIVLTMAHRGRLNVLVQLLNYPMETMVHKLEGGSIIPAGLRCNGDVLSHIDIHTDVHNRKNKSNSVHVSFIPNPSHLEAASPVAMGKTYARQKNKSSQQGYDGVLPKTEKDKVLCVMVHGDASVAGQGIIPETALLSNLNHYSVGGAIHVVANNQLGFTAMEHEGRSWQYCTDVAKMNNVPVFHVNSEYPEHVAYATKLAIDYRNKFHKDVWIDIVGWRKHGHNELDEPAFTQPNMYKNIRGRKSIPELYTEQLLESGVIKSLDEAKKLRESEDGILEAAYQRHSAAKSAPGGYIAKFDHLAGPNWAHIIHPSPQNLSHLRQYPDTSVEAEKLVQIGLASVAVPSDFEPHDRIQRAHIEGRQQKLKDGVKSADLDWATAEAMAIGSLLTEGHNVRISGQDACRGTFSQRHAKLTDQKVQTKTYMPLNNLPSSLKGTSKAYLEVVNSPLSEFGVMGFEYGHSWEDPNTLAIWEAQYGDFVNGAQIILDQFVASSDEKWLRQSGLVLLLPHGYDGSGPEHSSCHLERFLQSADTDSIEASNFSNTVPNWHVIQPTTPANYFHALRRQLKRNYLRPLIVATPKGLLRDPQAVSSVSKLASGNRFEAVLADPDHHDSLAPRVKTVVLCSGKIFYELRSQRMERKKGDIALIRVEELAPFPAQRISEEVARYPNAKRVLWVQDEPQNMGAWSYVEPRLRNFCNIQPHLISQAPLGSAAVGSSTLHKKITAKLYDDTFA